MRDYIDGCSGQLKACRTRKWVYDRTQPAVGEDEVPVNAPKWTTAGYNGSLKASVEKYTRRNVASSPEPLPPTAPSTASVKAGPSRTADIFYLDESTLVGENVLDSDSSSEEEDQKKKDSSSSEDESAVVKRVAVKKKRMTKERIRQKVAVQVVLVVKRKRMIAVKEKMSIIRMMKVIKKKTIRKTIGTKKKVLKIRKMIILRIIRLRMRRINVTIRMKTMKKQAIGLNLFINNFLYIYFSLILLIFFTLFIIFVNIFLPYLYYIC